MQCILIDSQSQLDVKKLAHLSPFKDSSGIWRVGGRLRNAFLPFDGKHPKIVPQDSPLARSLVAHSHRSVTHQGRMLTHSFLRLKGFFIPGARRMIESYIKLCGVCRRLRGQPVVPKMADLPIERLHESPVFTYVMMDCWGPYNVTEGSTTRKNSSSKKMWGLMFLCEVTRAVHIECLMSLDTTAMTNALRRFFAVRGVAKFLHTDCATNFVACCGEIGATKMYGCLKAEAERHECIWSFNAPSASHMNGSVERAIGSMRKILSASLLLAGNRAITRDELHTLFTEAACIINNTPLYHNEDSPDEPLAISPAHLMTLKDQPNPPPLSTFSSEDLNNYGKQRWKRVQVISQEFWRRWHHYYLNSLQSRSKWLKDRPNMRIGDAVIIKSKQLPRNDWSIGRVTATLPSSDNVVRVCEVKTPTGVFRRAVCDLIPLVPRELRSQSLLQSP